MVFGAISNALMLLRVALFSRDVYLKYPMFTIIFFLKILSFSYDTLVDFGFLTWRPDDLMAFYVSGTFGLRSALPSAIRIQGEIRNHKGITWQIPC